MTCHYSTYTSFVINWIHFLAPDKRQNQLPSEIPPNIPKRCQKKSQASSIFSIDSIVDISLDDSGEMQGPSQTDPYEHHDLRDSGISITDQNLNNFNNSSYEEYELRPHLEFNINMNQNDLRPQVIIAKSMRLHIL